MEMYTTLYKAGESPQKVPSLDAVEWVAKFGWSNEPVADQPTANEPVQRKSLDERNAELSAMNSTELKAVLQGYDLPISKPGTQSWTDFAIPQILKQEGYLV